MDGRISNFAQIASVNRYTITEGEGSGLDVIDCNNGKLRFLVNVSKACDVMQLYHEGVNVSFVSKNGFTKRELPFLNRFEGGMLYTCGLDSVGGREGYELHGTFHNTPAKITHCEVNENGICIEATVQSTALFGKNLSIKRKITSAVCGESVRVEDTLLNAGYADENYCLLYHVNVGYPMLDDGAALVADVETVAPRTPWAGESLDSMYQMKDSVVGEEECCYFLKLAKPQITLVNERIGKRFTLSYSADTLPCFVEWKSMASGDYALGLEPATTELDDRFQYRTVAPGESIQFSVTMTVEGLNQLS